MALRLLSGGQSSGDLRLYCWTHSPSLAASNGSIVGAAVGTDCPHFSVHVMPLVWGRLSCNGQNGRNGRGARTRLLWHSVCCSEVDKRVQRAVDHACNACMHGSRLRQRVATQRRDKERR